MLTLNSIPRSFLTAACFVIIIFCFEYNIQAQTDSLAPPASAAKPAADTFFKKEFRRDHPHFDTSLLRFKLRNEDSRFGKKLFRGTLIAMGYDVMATSLLLVLPEHFSNWDRPNYRAQFRHSYTRPPVVDGDEWYVNYLGHPYEGAFYYNALRSQGAKVWQSGLFCFVHSWLWEYTFEAGFEQPSVQDMVVTPIAGMLLGELFHFSTVRMSRNGFTWYEKMFVCVFNPSFAINNGFRYAGKPVKKQARL